VKSTDWGENYRFREEGTAARGLQEEGRGIQSTSPSLKEYVISGKTR